MKSLFIKGFAAMFLLGMFSMGCGTAEEAHEHSESEEAMPAHEDDHDHEAMMADSAGMDHEMMEMDHEETPAPEAKEE